MDKKTKGAWIIHHTNKLQQVTNIGEYEQINFAGKCGLLLSSLSSSEESVLTIAQVKALAKAINISVRLELPTILDELETQKLILRNQTGIEVLGVTLAATLMHTASIFESAEPIEREQAVIELAEKASDWPIKRGLAQEYIGDTFKIVSADADSVLNAAEEIGFVDAEKVGSGKLLFNGNLFRRDDATKINAVCSSLSEIEMSKMRELNEMLVKQGCLSLKESEQIVGNKLFKKLHSIGLYDVNKVGNEKGSFAFVTKPSAFSKFSQSDDAFDLAKAFVTSLTYGMIQSEASRGRIIMISLLMQKLIDGHWVGPATAIGQDYKVLEMRRVVQVEPVASNMFRMKLLKKEVGELALKVIMEGDASTESLPSLPGASVTSYTGPELTRAAQHKHLNYQSKQHIGEILNQIRTGRLE